MNTRSLTRRTLFATLAALSAAVAMPLSAAKAQDTIRIGVMAGESEDVFRTVAEEAAKQGLTLTIVPFSDYIQPNEALANGEIDANAFQHGPYLEAQIQQHGYAIEPVGYTLIQPIGLYTRKYDTVADIPDGAQIGIPNDPSNGGRALKLLEHEGLIKLRPDAGVLATAIDVEENPRNIRIQELDAGIVGRAIEDLDAAVVNTDWAFKAGLDAAEDRIAIEPLEDNPYRNFIAVRSEDKDKPWVKTLVSSFQNQAVADALEQVYKGTTLPAW